MKKMMMTIVMTLLTGQLLAAVVVSDKENGEVTLTGLDAVRMEKIILKSPVIVTPESYTLIIKTKGQDFNYRPVTVTTGKIVCYKNKSVCTVKGSEIRENGDGWFSPESGKARVFGLGTLARLVEAQDSSLLKCMSVYANVACDFNLKK